MFLGQSGIGKTTLPSMYFPKPNKLAVNKRLFVSEIGMYVRGVKLACYEQDDARCLWLLCLRLIEVAVIGGTRKKDSQKRISIGGINGRHVLENCLPLPAAKRTYAARERHAESLSMPSL